MLRDLRFALRLLLRHRGFALGAAPVTLRIGSAGAVLPSLAFIALVAAAIPAVRAAEVSPNACAGI